MSPDAGASSEHSERPALDAVLAAAEKNFAGVVDDLVGLSKIPSVSFPGYDAALLEQSATFTADLLKKSGFPKVEFLRLPGVSPAVFAESAPKSGKPTILFYAHHDVQPPMREELWKSPSFSPEIRDGRLYGRGTADDKAGVLLIVAAARAFAATSGLPLNVKVLIDGEEEIGSPHLSQLLEKNRERLKSDVLLIGDLTHLETGVPSLTTTLRGLAVVEVEVRALTKPLHSGMWGGPIPDSVTALSKIIAGLTDSSGRIDIPGIYDDVLAPRPDEVEAIRALNLSEKTFREQAGLLPGVALFGKKEELLLKVWREPSLVVNTLEAGSRRNAGNVLLDNAWARIGIRTVPNMSSKKTSEQLIAKIKSLCPWGLALTVTPGSTSDGWTTETSHPVFALYKKAMELGYGRPAVEMGCGGSIPFVGEMTAALGNIPALLLPVEDPYTNAHGENESLHLGDFKKGILSLIRFLHAYSR